MWPARFTLCFFLFPALHPSTRLVLGGGIRKRIIPARCLLPLQRSEWGGGEWTPPFPICVSFLDYTPQDSSVRGSPQATSLCFYSANTSVAGTGGRVLASLKVTGDLARGLWPRNQKTGYLVAWAGLELLLFLLSGMHHQCMRCWDLNSGLGLCSRHPRCPDDHDLKAHPSELSRTMPV